MPRIPCLGTAFMLLAAATVIAGCGRGPQASSPQGPSASRSASHPAVRLVADGRTLIPGGPPLPFHVSVGGPTPAGKAGHGQLVVYIGTVPDRLQVRDDTQWRDVALSWTNEQDDDGEFAAQLPLPQGSGARTRIDLRLFAADQQNEYENNRPRASYDDVSAEIQDGRDPAIHPTAAAARLRLPVDATHLTVTVPDILKAAPGGPPVEWSVRVRNSAGRRTRSGLRIAVSLAPSTQDASVQHVRWSIQNGGRWEDLTGRTYIETDEFALKPGASRTVRIRIALPPGPAPASSDGVGASLWASVGAPWWPAGPDLPSSGITLDRLGTNVLTDPASG